MMTNAFMEIFVVCSISGCGMILSGYVLTSWQKNNIFTQTDGIWIMVTSLIGLKGNLGMTLASRLSTQIKINSVIYWSYSYECLLIDQIQGILVGFIAGNLATIYMLLFDSNFTMSLSSFEQYIRLCFIGVTTSILTCIILGVTTVIIVNMATKWNIDPDHVATPLAAAMGDTITLILMQSISTLYDKSPVYLNALWLVVCQVIFVPVLYNRIKYTPLAEHLESGLGPIAFSLILSSCSGFILKQFVFKVKHLSTFQPLINGIGGNLVSILCSSMSSQYHGIKKFHLKESAIISYSNSLCVVLLLVGLSVHTIMVIIIKKLRLAEIPRLSHFIVPYFIAGLGQIITLLLLFLHILPKMWHARIDSDSVAIPISTGLGDLLGTLLLTATLAFI